MKTVNHGIIFFPALLSAAFILTSCNTKPARLETDQVTDTTSVELNDSLAETTAEEENTSGAITEDKAEEVREVTVKDTVTLTLPDNSSVMSKKLALELLTACGGGSAENTAALLNTAGFDVIIAEHYDKDPSDPSHTCAYTVGRGVLNGKNAYMIVIRGTSGGEWYSNFDFAPSHSNDTEYAENFMYAAQDIYLNIKNRLDEENEPYIFVCGHSRGAATANLLGVLLDNVYNKDNIFVYTFATPNTVREAGAESYDNIFNFINRADVVTYLPPEFYGFYRAGKDIYLNEAPNNSALITAVDTLYELAPDISSYYDNKYALDTAGTSDDGMSVFDIFNKLAGYLSGVETASIAPSSFAQLSENSDLFKPFMSLSSLADQTTSANALLEHMPAKYAELINALD